MILSSASILNAMESGEIVIDPFDPDSLRVNSYDLHLGNKIFTYDTHDTIRISATEFVGCLDSAKPPNGYYQDIYSWGFELMPGKIYLAATKEYTETLAHVPYIDGKSSVGRLGIGIHVSAGRGDVGFKGHWTLGLWCVQPVRIYAGTPIAQITYHTLSSPENYMDKPGSSYLDARDPLPQPSQLWTKIKK